jgi:hypothetical protein
MLQVSHTYFSIKRTFKSHLNVYQGLERSTHLPDYCLLSAFPDNRHFNESAGHVTHHLTGCGKTVPRKESPVTGAAI